MQGQNSIIPSDLRLSSDASLSQITVNNFGSSCGDAGCGTGFGSESGYANANANAEYGVGTQYDQNSLQFLA